MDYNIKLINKGIERLQFFKNFEWKSVQVNFDGITIHNLSIFDCKFLIDK